MSTVIPAVILIAIVYAIVVVVAKIIDKNFT